MARARDLPVAARLARAGEKGPSTDPIALSIVEGSARSISRQRTKVRLRSSIFARLAYESFEQPAGMGLKQRFDYASG